MKCRLTKQNRQLISGAVGGLVTTGGKVTGVLLEGQELGCDQVVLAAGPWSREAEDWLKISLPVDPLKGEILRAMPGAHHKTSRHVRFCLALGACLPQSRKVVEHLLLRGESTLRDQCAEASSI